MKALKQNFSGIRITLLVSCMIFFSATISFAATRYAVATGNWNATSTWSATSGGSSGASVPTGSDDVTIERGYTVTVNVSNAVALTLQVGGLVTGNGTITFNSGSQLTVSGAITLGNGARTGSLNFTSGGTLQAGSTFTVTTIGTFTPGAGTIDFNAAGTQTVPTTAAMGAGYNNLTLSGTSAKTTTGVTVNGILSMQGTATASAAITYGASAGLVYNTATARTANVKEWPATFSGTGGVTISNTGTIASPGNCVFSTGVPLTIDAGATLNPSNDNYTWGGDFINNGTMSAWTGNVTITGTATQSLSGYTTSNKTTFTKTGGTATFTSNCNFGQAGGGVDALIINGSGGTLNMGVGLTHTFDTGDITLTAGTWEGGSSTMNLTLVSTTVISGTGSIFSPGTSTVNFGAAGNQTTSCSAITFYRVHFSNSGIKKITTANFTVTDTVYMEGTATVDNDPTYGANATLKYNTATSRTVGAEWLTPFAASGGIVIASTGTITLDAAKVLNASVPLTVNSGSTLATGNFQVTLGGNFVNDGTFTAGSSNIVIAGTMATQSIDGFTTTGTVSSTKTSGTATFQSAVSGGPLTMNGTGGTLNLGSGLTHTFSGDVSLTAGTLNGGSSSLDLNNTSATVWSGTGTNFSAGTGTVKFNGAAQTLATASTFNNLTFANSGVKTLTGVPTVNGILMFMGTATISASPTYGSAATLKYSTTTSRTASSNEWITPFAATGGIIIASTGTITLNAAKVTNASVPVTINSGATLATGNFSLTFGGDFNNNGGTFTAGSAPILIANTMVTQGIDGFTTTGLVSMTKTAGTATFRGNVGGAGFTINGTGGTINLGAYTHTFSGDVTLTAGTLNAASSTLNVNSTSATAWNGTGSNFTAGTGTVVFGGAAQTLATASTFNNLTFATSGVKTLTGVPTVNGILSLEGTATISASPTYGAAATLQYNTSTSRTASSNEWITPFAATGGVIIASTGTITMNAAKVFSTSVPLTINSGATLATGNFQLTLGGDFINNGGTFTGGSAPVIITGTANQNIAGFTTTGAATSTKTAGTATFTGAVNVGSLTLNGNGGILKSGTSTGNNFTSSGALTLSDSATIQLGTGSHTISFGNSSGASWTAPKPLTILGWAGAYDGTSGTAGKLMLGANTSGSIWQQLDVIRFYNGSEYFKATVRANGEIVPNNNVFAFELVEFNAVPAANGNVNLSWITADESNISEYILERSSDSKNFNLLSQHSPLNNQEGTGVYEVADETPLQGDSWYRLSSMKKNGEIEVFEPKYVNLTVAGAIKVSLYPDPIDITSVIEISQLKAGTGTIIVVDMGGKEISKSEVIVKEGPNKFPVPLPVSAPKGNVVVMLNVQGQTYSKKGTIGMNGN